MTKLRTFINDHIDEFYQNKGFTRYFGTRENISKERDINIIMAAKTDSYKKEILLERMMDFCEKKMLEHRAFIYNKKISHLLQVLDKKNNFTDRVTYVDNQIEKFVKFFRPGHK